MAQVKQTVATFMANFFGKSEKAISEKLTTEEHNEFTTEVLNLHQELDTAQAAQNSLAAEKATLEATLATERDALAAEKLKVTGLEGEKTTLTGQLTEAETDRDRYKAWFEKQAGVGAQLPQTDASNQQEPELTNYNAHALEVFRQSKA